VPPLLSWFWTYSCNITISDIAGVCASIYVVPYMFVAPYTYAATLLGARLPRPHFPHYCYCIHVAPGCIQCASPAILILDTLCCSLLV
jgi:hypothetical protein